MIEMMKKPLGRKYVVIGVILLFVGAGFVPVQAHSFEGNKPSEKPVVGDFFGMSSIVLVS